MPPGFPRGAIRPRNADLFIGRDATPQAAREMIRAYLASVAWMDWNTGLSAQVSLGGRGCGTSASRICTPWVAGSAVIVTDTSAAEPFLAETATT